MSNIYYWQKLRFSKRRFSRNKNLKKCTRFQKQKGRRYIRGNVYFGIAVFSSLSCTNLCLIFLLSCFAQEIKGFYQSPLRIEDEFPNIMNVSPNILAKNSSIKILRHSFVDKRAMITGTLESSCHWESLPPFCLRKKTPEKTFLSITMNYRKIVQKNKLCHLKQQSICCLMIYDII